MMEQDQQSGGVDLVDRGPATGGAGARVVEARSMSDWREAGRTAGRAEPDRSAQQTETNDATTWRTSRGGDLDRPPAPSEPVPLAPIMHIMSTRLVAAALSLPSWRSEKATASAAGPATR